MEKFNLPKTNKNINKAIDVVKDKKENKNEQRKKFLIVGNTTKAAEVFRDNNRELFNKKNTKCVSIKSCEFDYIRSQQIILIDITTNISDSEKDIINNMKYKMLY